MVELRLLSFDEDGQVVSAFPSQIERFERDNSFTFERVEHGHVFFRDADHNQGMKVIHPIQRKKGNKNNRLMAGGDEIFEFIR